MTQPSQQRRRTGPWIVITILLAASLVGTLWVPFYARLSPRLGGFPFFYWYQLMWVPIVAILGAICYALSRPRRPAQRGTAAAQDGHPDPGAGGTGAAR